MYTADHLRISHDRPATGNTQHPRAKETTPHPASSTPAHHDSDAQARTRPQALTYPRTVQRHSLSGGDLNPLGPGICSGDLHGAADPLADLVCIEGAVAAGEGLDAVEHWRYDEDEGAHRVQRVHDGVERVASDGPTH